MTPKLLTPLKSPVKKAFANYNMNINENVSRYWNSQKLLLDDSWLDDEHILKAHENHQQLRKANISIEFLDDSQDFLEALESHEAPILSQSNLGPASQKSQFLPPLKILSPEKKLAASGQSNSEKSPYSKPPPPIFDVKRQLSPQRFITPELKKIRPNVRQYSTNHTILLQTQDPSNDVGGEQNPKPLLKPVKLVKPIVLSSEQEYILQLAKAKVSLFYTGSAGTGKSVLLRTIIKELRNQYGKGDVAVTASTGLAACNIGGITLHNFAGVGLGNGTGESLVKKVRKNRKALNRWKTVKVLIIDEISMIDGNFFDSLDLIAKKLRKNNLPFGGIQLIVCGDFYQLPPVSKHINIDGTDMKEKIEAPFAFESEAWKDAIDTTLVLREVFRQKGDQKFIDMLNDMRTGLVSDENNMEFKKLSRPLEVMGGIEPAQLYCTRYEVERANNTRLSLLKGSAYLYKAQDSGILDYEQRQNVLNNLLTPEKLFLKKGAQVMCVKNFDETLVNGSLGQVIDFIDRDTYMYYKNADENPEAAAEEIERMTEELLKNDKGEEEEVVVECKPDELSDSIFEFMEDVDIDLGDTQYDVAFKENINRKKEMMKNLYQLSTKNKYPLVKFLLPDKNHRTILVEPEQWTVEDENQEILAKRVQLPLILAWSLSIHKSQGQTLQPVKVDLRRVFENGQAYVALSRAVSREGLQVVNFDRYKVKTHPKVKRFYSSLITTEDYKKKGQQILDFKPQPTI